MFRSVQIVDLEFFEAGFKSVNGFFVFSDSFNTCQEFIPLVCDSISKNLVAPFVF